MTLLNAFGLTRRSLKMVLWLYGANLIASLLILLPAYTTLKSEAGHSLQFINLLDGFDYTIYADFTHNSDKAIDPLWSVGRWLGLFYVVLNMFFTGGILVQLSTAMGPSAKAPVPRLGPFLQGCAAYFRRFLRVSAVTVGLFFLLGLIGLLVIAVGYIAWSDFVNEKQGAGLLLMGSLVFGVPMTILLCAGDYARILLFRHDEQNALRAFRQALRFVLRHFKTTYGLYLLLIILSTLTVGLYFLVEASFQTTGWLLIGALFVLQQLLIFSRILLKVWTIATALTVTASHERQQLPV